MLTCPGAFHNVFAAQGFGTLSPFGIFPLKLLYDTTFVIPKTENTNRKSFIFAGFFLSQQIRNISVCVLLSKWSKHNFPTDAKQSTALFSSELRLDC